MPAAFGRVGYFFEPDPHGAASRDAARPDGRRVPPAGLFGRLKRLQRPAADEGFDELYTVRLDGEGGFRVEARPGAESGENG